MIYVTTKKIEKDVDVEVLYERFASSKDYIDDILSRNNDDSKKQSLTALHALLFLLDYVGEKTDGLVLARGTSGKPTINNGEWKFSVSHSSDYAVCGLSKTEIGVDLEKIRYMKNALPLAKRFFSSAEYDLMGKSSSDETFFKIWTKKEAYLKRRGWGIYTDLTKIDTSAQTFATYAWNGYVMSVDGDGEIETVGEIDWKRI